MAVINSVQIALIRCCLIVIGGITLQVSAAVLPEDKAETAYHYYDGGGVQVDGPAVFVRKSVADNLSLSGGYYVDQISSASIDVESYASSYSEERTEMSAGMTYVEKDSTIAVGYVNSDESDYESDTYHFDYQEEFFGGLSVFSLGYTSGSDDISSAVNSFSDEADRNHYRIGFSQVVTPALVLRANFEHISDSGFLASPYRKAIVNGVLYDEQMPRTRRSDAISVSADYFIETWSAALHGQYRYFSDTWDVSADDIRLSFTKTFEQNTLQRWIIEGWVRYYGQSSASFFQDQFDQLYEYRTRDKELSDFDSYSIGLGVEYALDDMQWFSDPSLALGFEWIQYEYNNFYEYANGSFAQDNNKQLYEFDATTAYVSFSTSF